MLDPSGVLSGLDTSVKLLTAGEEEDASTTSSTKSGTNACRSIEPYVHHPTTDSASVQLTVADLLKAEKVWNKKENKDGVADFCSAESVAEFLWDCQAGCVHGKTAVMDKVGNFFSDEQKHKRAEKREIFFKETKRAVKACEKGLRWSAHHCKKGMQQAFIAADGVLLHVFEDSSKSSSIPHDQSSVFLNETYTDADEIVFSQTEGTMSTSTIKSKKDGTEADVSTDATPVSTEDKDKKEPLFKHEYLIPLEKTLEDEECIEHRDEVHELTSSSGTGVAVKQEVGGSNSLGLRATDDREKRGAQVEEVRQETETVSVSDRRKRIEQIISNARRRFGQKHDTPIVINSTEDTEAKSNCTSKKLIDLTGADDSPELIPTSPRKMDPLHSPTSNEVIDLSGSLSYSLDSSRGTTLSFGNAMRARDTTPIDLTMYDDFGGAH